MINLAKALNTESSKLEVQYEKRQVVKYLIFIAVCGALYLGWTLYTKIQL